MELLQPLNASAAPIVPMTLRRNRQLALTATEERGKDVKRDGVSRARLPLSRPAAGAARRDQRREREAGCGGS